MTDRELPSRGLVLALAAIAVLVAAALWAPRWWENRMYRQAEAVAGVGAPVLPGKVTQARGRIDPGKTRNQVLDAVGRPSFAFGTQGSSVHDIWTYYYADGTMTVNLTDGYVKRISLQYGAPKIPVSKRP